MPLRDKWDVEEVHSLLNELDKIPPRKAAKKTVEEKTEKKRVVKREKVLLDSNKIHRLIRALDENDLTAYSVVIRRCKTGRSSYLKDYTTLINRFIKKDIDIWDA